MIPRLAGLQTLLSIKKRGADQKHDIHTRRQIIHSIHSRLNLKKTSGQKIADALVCWFGTFAFVFFHIAGFAVWIAINLNAIPPIPPFDPFPFNLLTMTVSLEAIFLSILVLISQNRESQIAELRQEFDLQINMIAESEITKVINLLAYLMDHLKVPYENDPELQHMMTPLNIEEIKKELERELKLPQQQIQSTDQSPQAINAREA